VDYWLRRTEEVLRRVEGWWTLEPIKEYLYRAESAGGTS